MKYVIIGNSAAAVGAVEGIRQIDKAGSVTIISEEPYHTYSRPLISYYLAEKVNEEQMKYRPIEFYSKNNVKGLLGCRALTIKTGEKTVVTDQGEIPYDKLLIASGGKPIIPPISGLTKKGVFNFNKWDDVKGIQELNSKGQKAVVIGAGLIGMKVAEALVGIGVETIVVELSNRILSSILDHKGAAIVKSHLEGKGIVFELNNTVTEVCGDGRVSSVLLKDGKKVTCDLVIVAIGVTPNLDVIMGTDIKYKRGIIVDGSLATNVPDVYAAGDVSEGYDFLYDEKRVLPILPNAYIQGETAGLAMAGAVARFDKGFAFNSISLLGLPVNTAGIVNPEADNYEILLDENTAESYYRKIILRDNRIVGFIMINGIDRSGILTGLIREGAVVGLLKQALKQSNFGYIHFSQEERIKKLRGGAGDA